MYSVLFNSTGRYFWFYFWQALFVFNEYTFCFKAFRLFCWNNIKMELFYVDGRCQHSGYCCNHMMLLQDQVPINEPSSYHKLKKNNSCYERFIPHFLDNQITYFSCSFLSKDNQCLDYKNRPQNCRSFPFNTFYFEDYIRIGCGYFVNKTQIQPQFKLKGLGDLYTKVLILNKLTMDDNVKT